MKDSINQPPRSASLRAPARVSLRLIAWAGLLIILGAAVTLRPVFGYPGFTQDAVEPAQVSQRETGVPASVTISQAIIESNWGDAHIGDANNYFGIKAFEQPDGSIYVGPVATGWMWADTTEYRDGQYVHVRARFRTYTDMADSFTDHGYFFWENERYHPAFQYENDPREFARQIAAAGYATGRGYADSLVSLMEKHDLFQYDVPGEAPPGEDVSGIVVDEQGKGFERSGAAQFWKQVGVGYHRHSYWAWAAPSTEGCWARWTPSLPASGIYEVFVYVPPIRASARCAQYHVHYAGAERIVEVNQGEHLKSWFRLGQFTFAADGEEWVRLSNRTGEPQNSGSIAFDAVRFVRVGDVPSNAVAIDDTQDAFQQRGTADFWCEASGGYVDHFWWTRNNQSALDNTARWNLDVEEAGDYEVFVYIPPEHATTTNAQYEVHHDGKVDTVVVNQGEHPNEWVSLGIHGFAGEGEECIFLGDATGEPTNTVDIAFDAVAHTCHELSFWEQLLRAIEGWIETWLEELQRKAEEWWEHWKVEQMERLERWFEEEFQRWLERQCTGTSLPVVLGLVTATIALRRRQRSSAQ